MAKILVISGSARKDSVNRKLGEAACRIGSELGAECELIDPREHVLPLYDGDLEEAEGLPEEVKILKKAFAEADGFVFCSPEYNSSITPLLKNLIDWVSRAESDDEPPLAAYRGKVAGLLSASPGALGGMRGLVHLRSILGNIGVFVTPTQFALGGAYGKFDENGELTDSAAASKIEAVMKEVITTAEKLSA
ncbi:FMN reductase [Haloferula helveola]|uniref:FMN reductase n=1 Tax=Haloferula helveola TaxID=490095 RepID=A0ABM7RAB0_9BACT|nr:FMN reductase [Haloferula helveola]